MNSSISKSLRASVLLVALTLAPFVNGVELTGKVATVIDGDTIHILRNDHIYKIRLGGIDAPESGQPYGNPSKKHLDKLVAGKLVKIEILKRDRYDRLIGKVWVQPHGCESCAQTLDANHAQILAGMAWWYEYYSKDQSPDDRGRYQSAEKEARGQDLGFWQEPHPVSPWDWRRGARQPLPSAAMDSSECGQKRYCRQMKTCEEARFYQTTCGVTTLDGDGDGVPCEKLCR